MSTVHKWHLVFFTILILADVSANIQIFQIPFFFPFLYYFFVTYTLLSVFSV